MRVRSFAELIASPVHIGPVILSVAVAIRSRGVSTVAGRRGWYYHVQRWRLQGQPEGGPRSGANPGCRAVPDHTVRVDARKAPAMLNASRTIRTVRVAAALLIWGELTIAASAQAKKTPPLVLKEQGSFFVGGEKKTLTQPAFGPGPAQSGDITVNQMYVQYQVPEKGDQHVPVVMVHGCCLSSKTWETTPDGRMGWSEYFVRKDRPVYLADQVSRARSGFDPTAFADVRQARRRPPRRRISSMPRTRSHGPSSASVRSTARRSPTDSSRFRRSTSCTNR